MATDPSSIDAFLDDAFGPDPDAAPSEPASESPKADLSSSEGAATPDDLDAEASADEDDDLPEAALDSEPAPDSEDASPAPDAPDDPRYAELLQRVEAAEREAQEAAQFKRQAQEAFQRAQEQQRREAEQRQRDEYARKRIAWLLENTPAEEHEEQVKRIAEEAYVAPMVQEARQVVEAERAERERIELELGSTASAMYLAAQQFMTPEQLEQWKNEVAYRRQFPTPTAMQQNAQREAQIRAEERERAKAEFERERNKRAAQRRQQRVASGVDKVSTGAPAVASTPKSDLDAALDALFGA